MLKPTRIQLLVSLTALLFAFFCVSFLFVYDAEARSRGGGRSFSRSKTYNKTPQRANAPNRNRDMSNRPRSSSFMRGLGGGLMGGFLGSMLFGGVGHGMGMGGFGGSGIGFFEILIFGGLIYFLLRKFIRRPTSSHRRSAYPSSDREYASGENSSPGPSSPPDMVASDPVPEGIDMIRASDPAFDPEEFKEFAQDVFFKVQAAWTRRDITVMQQFLGQQLLAEYERHFDDLKRKGEVNRLENIAVRKVVIVDAGEIDGEEFAIVNFTANLLDYTVDESSGNVVEGDSSKPIKFDERWAFARARGTSNWKLEGIQGKGN